MHPPLHATRPHHTLRRSLRRSRPLAVAAASLLGIVAIPASASFAGGGGSVAGKCGTITSLSASNVQLSPSGTGYTASTLQLRGNVVNCSIYLQNYWIDVDEPTATNTACRASFSLFNALLLSSGSTQGWTATTNITPAGVATTAGCVGPHTVRAVLRSRTDGSVLSTATVPYTVTSR